MTNKNSAQIKEKKIKKKRTYTKISGKQGFSQDIQPSVLRQGKAQASWHMLVALGIVIYI